MARLMSVSFISPCAEILGIGGFVFAHAATQCYWYFFDDGFKGILSSIETKGFFQPVEETIVKSVLHGLEFAKYCLTPVYLVLYLLMFHTLLFGKAPARLVPWLLLAAVKDVVLGAILTLTQAFICYVIGFPGKCIEASVALAAELAVQLYLWGSSLLLYQELAHREIAAEGEAFWAAAAAEGLPLASSDAASPAASSSEWEATPAGQRAAPKRRRNEDSEEPSTPTVGQALQITSSGPDPFEVAHPNKKRVSPQANVGVHKAVQANTLSRRWLQANSEAKTPPKTKSAGTRLRARSGGAVSAAVAAALHEQADSSGGVLTRARRSPYTHQDVSPRQASASWLDEIDDGPTPQVKRASTTT